MRTTGRGYYATQQVSDLLAYLRLLRNRYDDVALLTVLASPLVGMSNDGLLRVRRAAVKRPIFTAFERDEPAPGLSPATGGSRWHSRSGSRAWSSAPARSRSSASAS